VTDLADRTSPDEIALTRPGRVARTVAALAGLLLITAGTLFGSDDDFPVGPLRMYSVRDDPNSQVTQAVVLATTADGHSFDVSDTGGAPRRAELEGRYAEFEQDPARFDAVAVDYVTADGEIRGHAGAIAVEVRLVRRVYPLQDGRRRGAVRDELIAQWVVSR
jgi:hypothetical protein